MIKAFGKQIDTAAVIRLKKKSFDEKLYREVLDDFDIRKTFCGFGGVRLEEIMYAIYGLMNNGYTTEACALAESSVRDVVRAQFIAEAYTSDDKPAVSGVRPSIFEAIQLIDSVWILNGFRYDSGAPRTHTLFGGGYIGNLHENGKIFNAESVSN